MARVRGVAGFLAFHLPFYYGWVVVAVGFTTLGIGYTARAVFSLLFPPILDEFGWQRADTAAVFSVGFASAALYMPLMGYWLDRFGPGIVLPVGAVMVSAGFILTTVSTEVWHFILSLGALVVGASTLLAYNAHFVFVPNWFETRRGLALGIVSSGAGVISILALPLLQELIDTQGWRSGCIAYAAILLAVVLPLTLVLQRRRPQDFGLNPDGVTGGQGAAGGPEGRIRIMDAAWVATDWTLVRAMATLRFWMIALGFASGLFVWYAIMVHQTRYLLDLGFDSTLAALALGLVPMCGVAGQIGFGWLSDRIGREWVWTMSCLGFAITYGLLLVLAQHPSLGLVFAMVVVQGFLGFSLAAVYGAIAADIFMGRNYGLIYGTLAIAGNVGAALGPWSFGLVHDLAGSYGPAFVLAIGVSFLSIACIWLAAPRKVRAVGRQRAR
jgi:MFS family permease